MFFTLYKILANIYTTKYNFLQTPHLHIHIQTHPIIIICFQNKIKNKKSLIILKKKKKKLNTQLTPLQTFKSFYQKYKKQYQTKQKN